MYICMDGWTAYVGWVDGWTTMGGWNVMGARIKCKMECQGKDGCMGGWVDG